jgi:protein TonB
MIMKRLLASSSVATIVVFGLFVLMVGMIHQEAPAYTGERVIFPNKVHFDETEIIKDPIIPTEEPELVQEVQPEILTQPIQTPKAVIDYLDTSLPTKFKLSTGTANTIPRINPGTGNNGDNEANPIVMIQPQYPQVAAYNNIEGWVKLRYDITKTGTVQNVTVIKAKPRGVFEQSAKKALYRWKYNPSSVNGKSVASIGHEVMLEFNFEKE